MIGNVTRLLIIAKENRLRDKEKVETGDSKGKEIHNKLRKQTTTKGKQQGIQGQGNVAMRANRFSPKLERVRKGQNSDPNPRIIET